MAVTNGTESWNPQRCEIFSENQGEERLNYPTNADGRSVGASWTYFGTQTMDSFRCERGHLSLARPDCFWCKVWRAVAHFLPEIQAHGRGGLQGSLRQR